MKKFKVYYTFHDGSEWVSHSSERIVEANDAQEAKELVHGYDNACNYFDVYKVEEVQQ